MRKVRDKEVFLVTECGNFLSQCQSVKLAKETIKNTSGQTQLEILQFLQPHPLNNSFSNPNERESSKLHNFI